MQDPQPQLQPQPLTFSPSLYKKLVPSQFLQRHILNDPPTRPSNRALSGFRQISITTGSLSNTFGSALVRCGETVMVCGIRAEIMEPDLQTPHQGQIIPNLELGPLSSSRFKGGPPSETQQSITRALVEFLGNCKVVDERQLCIEEGKAAWVLYADIICLSACGAHYGTAALALLVALCHTTLPDARYDQEQARVVCSRTRKGKKVEVGCMPFVFEVGVFEGRILADPDDEEDELCHEHVVVTLDRDGTIYALQKGGGAVVQEKEMDEVVRMCEARVSVIDRLVRESLASPSS